MIVASLGEGGAKQSGANYTYMSRYLANGPMRGEYNTENVGRTPNSAAEPVLKDTEKK